MKYAAIASCLIILTCQATYSLTLSLTGAEITCEYDEPNTNSDGSILTDLLKTTLYYGRGNGIVKAKDIPAMSLTGGGHIVTTILVPVLGGEDVNVNVWATASDTATITNESIFSSTATIRIDRLPPNKPR